MLLLPLTVLVKYDILNLKMHGPSALRQNLQMKGALQWKLNKNIVLHRPDSQRNSGRRLTPNESDVVRYNIFVAYCPSWGTPADRFHSSPEWLKTLNREQRIIMRSYSHAYHNAKPPASEFPLFLERDTGTEEDLDAYQGHVQLHRRKRQTMHERLTPLAENA